MLEIALIKGSYKIMHNSCHTKSFANSLDCRASRLVTLVKTVGLQLNVMQQNVFEI